MNGSTTGIQESDKIVTQHCVNVLPFLIERLTFAHSDSSEIISHHDFHVHVNARLENVSSVRDASVVDQDIDPVVYHYSLGHLIL